MIEANLHRKFLASELTNVKCLIENEYLAFYDHTNLLH
jgi:hypothetical protein